MNDLTETTLGESLKLITGKDWIHDKAFLTRSRPDYRNDELKMLVEFDGPYHYTSATRIVQDEERDKLYTAHGYKTVRIPMYIQLSTYTVKELFGIDKEFKQVYPHGFISDAKTLVLPADFCELGIMKFKSDLERFSEIQQDIINSLRVKIEKLGDIRKVLPPSLFNIVS